MNNYGILKIPNNSTEKVIKTAYRKLVKIHHPDKGGDKKHFIKIQKAYEELLKGNTGELKKYFYSPFQQPIISSIKVVSTELDDKGNAKFQFDLHYVDYIEFNNNKYLVNKKFHSGYIFVSKKELEKIGYQVDMFFKGLNGKWLEKSWSVKKPPLTRWQKFKKLFKI